MFCPSDHVELVAGAKGSHTLIFHSFNVRYSIGFSTWRILYKKNSFAGFGILPFYFVRRRLMFVDICICLKIRD